MVDEPTAAVEQAFVQGSLQQTLVLTEKHQGDGEKRAFIMAYEFAKRPSVYVNGIACTVGIKGVDTGAEWSWAMGDAILSQDSGSPTLQESDILTVTYVGQFSTLMQSHIESEPTS